MFIEFGAAAVIHPPQQSCRECTDVCGMWSVVHRLASLSSLSGIRSTAAADAVPDEAEAGEDTYLDAAIPQSQITPASDPHMRSAGWGI